MKVTMIHHKLNLNNSVKNLARDQTSIKKSPPVVNVSCGPVAWFLDSRLLHCKRVFNADLQKTPAGIQWKLVVF
ncbi:hypothetical protein LB504_001680 [Fusarium proliferatum]|nr:hypothetical protein LB504_001680 [Fusarium proliferatum]